MYFATLLGHIQIDALTSRTKNTQNDITLGLDCIRHSKMFFNSKDLDLLHCYPGSFSIMPTQEMIKILKRDYNAMTGMIFGEVPKFSDVLEVIIHLEDTINRAGKIEKSNE